MPTTNTAAKEPNLLEKFLGLFAEVKRGEGVVVVLMFLNILMILSAYYVLKVVRKQLTLGGVSIFGIDGAEVESYLAAVLAMLMIAVVPAYGWLASRYDRIDLIKRTTLIVVAGLFGFVAWGTATGIGTEIGVAFYVFLGVINVFLIAQFWSYANDIYDEKQGKRLFAIIAIGQSLGAVLGPKLADLGADYIFVMLGLCGLTLLCCLFLYVVVNRSMKRAAEGDAGKDSAGKDSAEPKGDAAKSATTEEPLSKEGGFSLVFKTKYLLYIALMILTTNLVNTTGEYILSEAATQDAEEQIPVSSVVEDLYSRYQRNAEGDDAVPEAWKTWFGERSETEITAAIAENEWDLSEEMEEPVDEARSGVIGKFFGEFYLYVNLAGLLIQMFFVSRIFKYFGVRAALFVLPVLAFAGYAAIGIIGGLLVLRIAKTAENATDYSLQNTIKQALFLPTSREAKYKAKAVIDMFFVRFGDAMSAAVVFVGSRMLDFTIVQFAFVNVGLCAVWIMLNVGIAREHRKLVPTEPKE